MIIIEIIIQFVIEIIFGKIILGLFALVRKLGIGILILITFDDTPFNQLSEGKYKGSSLPYWIGFLIIAGLIFLSTNVI